MFRSTNVPFDQCSIRPMFRSTNVPFDQCSIRPMFLRRKCIRRNCLRRKYPHPLFPRYHHVSLASSAYVHFIISIFFAGWPSRSSSVSVSRKLFHAVVVCVYGSGTLVAPSVLLLANAGVIGVLLLLEVKAKLCCFLCKYILDNFSFSVNLLRTFYFF